MFDHLYRGHHIEVVVRKVHLLRGHRHDGVVLEAPCLDLPAEISEAFALNVDPEHFRKIAAQPDCECAVATSDIEKAFALEGYLPESFPDNTRTTSQVSSAGPPKFGSRRIYTPDVIISPSNRMTRS